MGTETDESVYKIGDCEAYRNRPPAQIKKMTPLYPPLARGEVKKSLAPSPYQGNRSFSEDWGGV